jgi:hypothetical protein
MAISSYEVLGQVTSGIYEKLPVTSRGLSTNQAFVGTPVAHDLSIGDVVEVWFTDQALFNRKHVVSKIGKNDDTNPETFVTFSLTNANIAEGEQTSAYLYKYKNGNGKRILNKERASGLAQLLSEGNHGLDKGDLITVDINDTNFDGDWVVYDTPSASAFRYINIGANVSSASVVTATGPGAIAVQKAQTVFSVPSSSQSIISTLAVSNTLTHSCYFYAYIVKNGDSKTAPPDKSIIANRVSLDPGETYSMTMGYTLDQGDALVVRSSHAGLYYTAFGTLLK